MEKCSRRRESHPGRPPDGEGSRRSLYEAALRGTPKRPATRGVRQAAVLTANRGPETAILIASTGSPETAVFTADHGDNGTRDQPGDRPGGISPPRASSRPLGEEAQGDEARPAINQQRPPTDQLGEVMTLMKAMQVSITALQAKQAGADPGTAPGPRQADPPRRDEAIRDEAVRSGTGRNEAGQGGTRRDETVTRRDEPRPSTSGAAAPQRRDGPGPGKQVGHFPMPNTKVIILLGLHTI